MLTSCELVDENGSGDVLQRVHPIDPAQVSSMTFASTKGSTLKLNAFTSTAQHSTA